MATVAPPMEGSATAPSGPSQPSTPAVPPSAAPPRRALTRAGLFRHTALQLNLLAAAGAVCVFVGGLLYASAEMTYVNLAGAAPFASADVVFDMEGVGYVFLGLGIFLSFAGIARGLPTIGGIVALFGALLEAVGLFGYASIRGKVPLSGELWTNTLDAVGFLFLALGLAIGIGGLALLVPRRGSVVDSGSWRW